MDKSDEQHLEEYKKQKSYLEYRLKTIIPMIDKLEKEKANEST